MRAIPPYSEADWQAEWEAGRPLACPRCGSSDDFGPRHGVQADRTFRRYRACKRCGLFQEADGRSPPYQTLLMVHDCDGRVAPDTQCRGCGLRLKAGGRHLCPRIVREGDVFTCPECGTVLGEEHRQPWPERGPWT
jgi:uncharacterized Zn finger protein